MAQYQLPELPYAYEALEPVISAEIMKLHHSKHHQAYVNNLNAALEAYAKADLEGQIALEPAIRFNGGGHINHSIFWTNLCPKAQFVPPSGALLKAIEGQFGSLQAFIDKFTAAATAIQGSGWAWLGYRKATKRLAIVTTSNQDPVVTQNLVPLLGIDVWEHAYYLQYKNVRADYVKAIWQIINWKNVEQRYGAL